MAARNLNSRLLGTVEPDQGRSGPLRPHLKNMRWAFLGLRKLWYPVKSPSPNSAMSQRKQGGLACSIQSPGVEPRLELRQLRSQAELCSLLCPITLFPSQPHDPAMRRSKNSFFLGFSFLEFGPPSRVWGVQRGDTS